MLRKYNRREKGGLEMGEKLNFADYSSQIELIVDSLEKKEKKKAVSYYLRETTINRIKDHALKFDMKDSQFLEEVLLKVMDKLESEEEAANDLGEMDIAGDASYDEDDHDENNYDEDDYNEYDDEDDDYAEDPDEDYQAEDIEASQQTSLDLDEDLDEESLEYDLDEDSYEDSYEDSLDDDLDDNNQDVNLEPIDKKVSLATSEERSVQGVSLTDNECALVDYLYHNYRQDYRMRYEDYERLVYDKLAIAPDELKKITRKLHAMRFLTYMENHSLLDINRDLFDLWE